MCFGIRIGIGLAKVLVFTLVDVESCQMNTAREYQVFCEQQQCGGELTVRLAGVSQQELRHRLLRLGCYLRVLSDAEFREFGRALVTAVGDGRPPDGTVQR